jgi:hypothetical protein
MDSWKVQQGTTLIRIVELRYASDDIDGSYRRGDKVVGVYAGTEPLSMSVWEGSDQAPEAVSSSTVAWHSAANGEIKVTLDEANTAGWPVGPLRLQLYLTVGGKRFPVFGDDEPQLLEVLPAPGVAVDLPTYASFADLVREAPWIRDLVRSDPTRHSDFEDYLNQARIEMDSIIQRHYRGETIDRQANMDYLLDAPAYRSAATSTTLQTWLDDDRLILTTPNGQRIKRWCALYAAWRVSKTEIGDSDAATAYRKFGANCWHEANAMTSTLVAEIDTTDTADGVADIVVDFATADTLRG